MTQAFTVAQRWYSVNNMDRIYDDLKALADEYAVIAKDEPMNKHCTFKVGGPADYFVTVGDVESFGAMVNYAKTNNNIAKTQKLLTTRPLTRSITPP